MANESITLKTAFSNGTHGEAKLYHFVQLDAEGQPLASPPALVASSNQATYVQVFTHVTDPSLAADAVDIRSVSKAPSNITHALVTVTDGRTLNGQPVQYQIDVAIAQQPDLSAVAVASSDPVRTL
jgi:hypothetical protein